MEKIELYKAALDTWDLGMQLSMLAEECAELAVAALHYMRWYHAIQEGDEGVPSHEHPRKELIEEIADVQNMVGQIMHALNLEEDVENMIDYKLERLRKRIIKKLK